MHPKYVKNYRYSKDGQLKALAGSLTIPKCVIAGHNPARPEEVYLETCAISNELNEA